MEYLTPIFFTKTQIWCLNKTYNIKIKCCSKVVYLTDSTKKNIILYKFDEKRNSKNLHFSTYWLVCRHTYCEQYYLPFRRLGIVIQLEKSIIVPFCKRCAKNLKTRRKSGHVGVGREFIEKDENKIISSIWLMWLANGG